MPSIRRFAPIAALALLLAVGCGSDDDGPTAPRPVPTVPASWAGEWAAHAVLTLCDSKDVALDTTFAVMLCEGDAVQEVVPGAEVLCIGTTPTVTDTTFAFLCTQSFVDGTCHTSVSIEWFSEVDPVLGTMTGSGTYRIQQDPPTAECPEQCLTISITGTRIGPATGCAMPIAARRTRR